MRDDKRSPGDWLGANDHGAIGDGADAVAAEPTPVLRDVKAVSGGGGHTCALRDEGSTWCWGWNPYGQVGDGRREDRLAAVEVLVA